jgi:hypothetical protein
MSDKDDADWALSVPNGVKGGIAKLEKLRDSDILFSVVVEVIFYGFLRDHIGLSYTQLFYTFSFTPLDILNAVPKGRVSLNV